MKKILLPILLGILTSVSTMAAVNDTTRVRVHDHVDMTTYANYDQVGYFPTAGKIYNKVLMNFSLGCASGGCSDWDYDVHIQVMKNTGRLDSNIIRIDTISFSPVTLDTVWNVYTVEEAYEMARVITPYGGYMRLNQNGYSNAWEHRHMFDVTDFVGLLQDSVKLRSFFSGWSNGFDVTLDFYFIEGTPDRNVLSIQNIFQGGAGYPDAATFNLINTPPKNLTIPSGSKLVKVRVIPTGHGFDNDVNCSEFCPKMFSINLDGSAIVNNTIWDDQCGMNPVFPQAGTWIFDRANWCPGKRAKIFENDITNYVSAGNSYNFDFDVEAFTWTGAQQPYYSITAQLVTYGDYNFNTDAELAEIVSPNNHEDFKRYNPASAHPIVEIKNNGKNNLTSADIKYWADGADPCWYNWHGNLAYGQTERITLPIYDFYQADTLRPMFNAEVVYPTNDQWSYNNKKRVPYNLTPTYPSRMELYFRTNTRPTENTYVLIAENGDTLKKFTGTGVNTLYKDTFDLLPGSYSFQVFDIYGDGMSDFPLGQGDGVIQLRRFTGSSTTPYITLEKDFGTRNIRNFLVGYRFGNGEDYAACSAIDHTSVGHLNSLADQISIYPNPATNHLFISAEATFTQDISVKIMNMQGQEILHTNFAASKSATILDMDITSIENGIYLVKIADGVSTVTKKVIVNK